MGTVGTIRDGESPTVRDGEPRTASSTFTQLLTSENEGIHTNPLN